jgi:hypothetical protein
LANFRVERADGSDVLASAAHRVRYIEAAVTLHRLPFDEWKDC